MRSKKCKRGNLLSFHVIVAASNGDVDAINQVLKHYEPQQRFISTR